MSDNVRSRAEVVETDDGYEVRPPTVRREGDVPDALLEAVYAAVDDEPHTVADPALASAESGSDYSEQREHHVAYFYANYQEQPVVGDDGEIRGWRAPYQAREDFDAALREHLPDGYTFEARDNSTTTFYRE